MFKVIGMCAMCLVTQSCPTLCDSTDCRPPGSSVQGDSPGKNTGVGCHACLQGIFPIQGSNPGIPHCRLILYHLNHKGSQTVSFWLCTSAEFYVNVIQSSTKSTTQQKCIYFRKHCWLDLHGSMVEYIFVNSNKTIELSIEWKLKRQ